MIKYHSFCPTAIKQKDGTHVRVVDSHRQYATPACEGRRAEEKYAGAITVAYFGANSSAFQSERYVLCTDVTPSVAAELRREVAANRRDGEFHWAVPAAALKQLGLEPDWAD